MNCPYLRLISRYLFTCRRGRPSSGGGGAVEGRAEGDKKGGKEEEEQGGKGGLLEGEKVAEEWKDENWLQGGSGPEKVEGIADAECDYDLGEGGEGEGEGQDGEEGGEEEDAEEEEEANGGPVLVLPLYSMLPAAEQMRVWSPPPKGTRLIVVATNIRRVPVDAVVLQMKAMGLLRVHAFPFPEPPPPSSLDGALSSLACLGALAEGGREAPPTSLGIRLSRLPIAPRLGKLVLLSRERGLLPFGLLLAAMLAQQDPYDRGRGGEVEGDIDGDGEGEGEGEGHWGAGKGGGETGGESWRTASGGGEEVQVRAAGEGGQGERWRCDNSEALNLLGAFLQWQKEGASEEAAVRCSLVPKVKRERIPSLPTRRDGDDWGVKMLRQLLLQVGSEVKPALMRKAYLAAEHASGQLLWLPPLSDISTRRPRPKYLAAFYEVNHAKRPYMLCATAIEPGWLPDASPALTSLGPIHKELAPRYDRHSDQPLGWVTPTYGSARWVLPVVAKPPSSSEQHLRGAMFARVLCEGQARLRKCAKMDASE
ncbi:MAG: hypothetical protein SGPRY_006640 [Prymnesium sp.]